MFFSNNPSAAEILRDLVNSYEQTHHGIYFPPGAPLPYTIRRQTNKYNNELVHRGYTCLVFPSTAPTDVAERYREAIRGLPKDVNVDTLRSYLVRKHLNVVCYAICGAYYMRIDDSIRVTHTHARPIGYLFKLHCSVAGVHVDPTCVNMVWMTPPNSYINENFNLI